MNYMQIQEYKQNVEDEMEKLLLIKNIIDKENKTYPHRLELYSDDEINKLMFEIYRKLNK